MQPQPLLHPRGHFLPLQTVQAASNLLFAIAYKRLVLDTELYEINKYFIEIAQKRGFYSDAVMNKVSEQVISRG